METKDKKELNEFQKAIKAYLEARAASDELFAQSYAKENKNIEECCNFIVNEVKKSGRAGFADDEIFGLAVHYYDEDNLGDIKPIKAKVVVNHSIDLSEEEKAEAKARAIAKYEADCLAEVKRKEKEEAEKKAEAAKRKAEKEAEKRAEASQSQGSLFDF